MRLLRRLYIGCLGDVLRERQAINAQLRSAMQSSVEGRRQTEAEYLKVRTSRTLCKIWLNNVRMSIP